MADAIVRKIAKDQVRGQMSKRNGYIFSAPDKNERGHKLSKSEMMRWELERYTDPRWAIPEKDLKILMEVKRRAKQLDAGHRIGPLKFGQAAVLGLVPVVGDFADVILAYTRVYRKASKVSKGDDVFAFKSKMKVRIVACGAIGAIPMLGDFADTILKFNTQNAALLEKLLLKRSGYFEVLAKEKALRKGRSDVGKPASRDHSAPPPRYESPRSNPRIPYHQASAGVANDAAHKVKGVAGLLHGASGSRSGQVELAPQRPPRTEKTNGKAHGQYGNRF